MYPRMYTSTFYHILTLDFSKKFVDKIAIILSKFPDKVHNIPSVQKPEIRSKINSFERATENKISTLTKKIKEAHVRPLLKNISS